MKTPRLYRVLFALGLTTWCSPLFATFTVAATHPDASALYAPGTSGATIKDIRAYNNRLYMGYSENDAIVIRSACPAQDWYATYNPDDDPNDGFCKMKLRYYDPATGNISGSQATFKSQGMNTLTVSNGILYALATDPDDTTDYVRCTTSSCAKGSVPSAAHVYSMTNIGSSLYMSGSSGVNATIWKSTNNGSSWSTFFQRGPTAPGPSNDFSRYYNVGTYQGKIHAHATDAYSSDPTFSDIFTGSTRNSGPALFPGHGSGRSVKEFAGKMVGIRQSRLHEYDGVQPADWFYPPYISDFTISNGYIFVLHLLQPGPYIYRSKDLETWTRFNDSVPANAKSIEILNSKLYVGATDSKVYVSDVDPYKPIIVAPVNYLLLLN